MCVSFSSLSPGSEPPKNPDKKISEKSTPPKKQLLYASVLYLRCHRWAEINHGFISLEHLQIDDGDSLYTQTFWFLLFFVGGRRGMRFHLISIPFRFFEHDKLTSHPVPAPDDLKKTHDVVLLDCLTTLHCLPSKSGPCESDFAHRSIYNEFGLELLNVLLKYLREKKDLQLQQILF